MSDKPPEKLYMFFNHVTVRGRILYTGGDTKGEDDDIEYIRADVAKEHEVAEYKRGYIKACDDLSEQLKGLEQVQDEQYLKE